MSSSTLNSIVVVLIVNILLALEGDSSTISEFSDAFLNLIQSPLHRSRRQEPKFSSQGQSDSSLLPSPVSSTIYSYREVAPKFHFAVYDEQSKICILAKFDASFTITYDTKYGPQQMIDRLISNPNVTGVCESYLDEKPWMDIRWRGGFVFRLIFKKVSCCYFLEILINYNLL